MGAWGAGLFENDQSMDVRGIATELMSLGVPADRVTAALVEDFAEPGDNPDFWLGLAMTQHKAGRVDEPTKLKAIALIDTGRALQEWIDGVEPGDPTIKQRERHLKKARETLAAPAPTPTRLKVSVELRRRIDRSFEDFPWRLDGLYAYRVGDATAVFAASVVQDSKQERWYRTTPNGYEVMPGPVLKQATLVLLDYVGSEPPTAEEARALRPYSAPPSEVGAAATGRSIELMHAKAQEHAAETFEAFCERTRDMLGHFTPEQLRDRYDLTKEFARNKAAALKDTAAAVRRHYFKRFLVYASDAIPKGRLIDLGVSLDTEAAAAAHDYTRHIEQVTWSELDKQLLALGIVG